MTDRHSEDGTKLVEVQAFGTLVPTTCRHFVPALERLFRGCGKVRVLFEMSDLQGRIDGRQWRQLRLDLTQVPPIERLALVGDTKWQRHAVMFCRPFTTGPIRYFDRAAIRWARTWLADE